MAKKTITIITAIGELTATLVEDFNYPGINIWLNEELVAIVEVPENSQAVSLHLYDSDTDSPIATHSYTPLGEN